MLNTVHGRRPGQIVRLGSPCPSPSYSVALSVLPVTLTTTGPTWEGVAAILGVGLVGLVALTWVKR